LKNEAIEVGVPLPSTIALKNKAIEVGVPLPRTIALKNEAIAVRQNNSYKRVRQRCPVNRIITH
jgi:hypothetical protein